MSNLFLLCIPGKDIAQVIQRMDDWQKKHHNQRFNRPWYLDEETPPVINAPDYEVEQEMEVQKEMSQPPSHMEKVK